MLERLRVRNYAVVEDVEVRFAPGLNVLTGETGAGKSVLSNTQTVTRRIFMKLKLLL